MNSIVNSLCKPIAIIFVIFAISFQRTFALTCYDNTDGEMQLVSNDDWTFCTLIPDSNVNSVEAGKVSGLSAENDDIAPYMLAFGNSDDKYQVLSLCIYERYDFRQFNPKFQVPELLFRCVCNYDKCNARTTFDNYLHNLASKPELAAAGSPKTASSSSSASTSSTSQH
uniref:Uncharacterized protein n=1 Tax=Panagrolaimus sp. ES5 TaxID=591445 RepID=A0AC34FXP2_9BILA